MPRRRLAFNPPLRVAKDQMARDIAKKRAELNKGLRKAMVASTLLWQNAMKQRASKPSAAGTDGLQARTGTLRRSFFAEVEGDTAETLVGRVGTTSPYAPIHEFGGTIRPKNAQYLTIPLPDAMTPGGVPRRPSIRDWEGFFFRSKGGNLLFAQKLAGNSDRLSLLYILKKQVRLKAQLGMLKTWKGQGPERERLFQRAITEAISK